MALTLLNKNHNIAHDQNHDPNDGTGPLPNRVKLTLLHTTAEYKPL